MSQDNLHQTTPTQFLDIGGARLSYRSFGKEQGTPLVFANEVQASTAAVNFLMLTAKNRRELELAK